MAICPCWFSNMAGQVVKQIPELAMEIYVEKIIKHDRPKQWIVHCLFISWSFCSSCGTDLDLQSTVNKDMEMALQKTISWGKKMVKYEYQLVWVKHGKVMYTATPLELCIL